MIQTILPAPAQKNGAWVEWIKNFLHQLAACGVKWRDRTDRVRELQLIDPVSNEFTVLVKVRALHPPSPEVVQEIATQMVEAGRAWRAAQDSHSREGTRRRKHQWVDKLSRGTLTDFGWSATLDEVQRRGALRTAIAYLGKQRVEHTLSVLRTTGWFPAYKSVVESDLRWIGGQPHNTFTTIPSGRAYHRVFEI